jgi:hypothetical protein
MVDVVIFACCECRGLVFAKGLERMAARNAGALRPAGIGAGNSATFAEYRWKQSRQQKQQRQPTLP